jgi:hypothetical protein
MIEADRTVSFIHTTAGLAVHTPSSLTMVSDLIPELKKRYSYLHVPSQGYISGSGLYLVRLLLVLDIHIAIRIIEPTLHTDNPPKDRYTRHQESARVRRI